MKLFLAIAVPSVLIAALYHLALYIGHGSGMPYMGIYLAICIMVLFTGGMLVKKASEMFGHKRDMLMKEYTTK